MSSSTHSPNALPPAGFGPQNRFTPTATSFEPFRTSIRVRAHLHLLRGIVTDDRWVSHPVLSDTFSEGKLKDLRDSFPPDQPTELDDHSFLDDDDLEDVDDDPGPTTKATAKTQEPTAKTPGTTPAEPGTPLKGPVFGSGFASAFSPEFEPQLKNAALGSPICSTLSVDTATHLGKGKVVVLRDVSFVT